MRTRTAALRILAIVGVATLCGACAPSAGPSDAPARVVIRALAYEPADLSVSAGTRVVWTSEDVAAHDVTADDGTFASGTLQQGGTWSHTFTSAGSWAYHCTIHPEMTGTVTVR